MFRCFLYCLILLLVSGEEDIVSYYEKLINENVERANNYKLPTDASSYRPHNTSIKTFGVFDFIIIGAGSTGTVIANRLTEVKHWNVLLLEAGTYGNNFTEIPGMAFVNHQSPYNWGYKTVPQKESCLALKNSQCPYPRGRGMGGSSLINGLVYSRGSRNDFDRWSEMGNSGWSYAEVLPYFKKSENFNKNNEFAPVDDGFHNTGGFLNVEYQNFSSEESSAFLEALREKDYQGVDYNGANNLGYSPIQANIKYGKRQDGVKSFVDPIKSRPNLVISINSYVIRILIQHKQKAYGVEFIRDGQKYRAFVKKEVILSAGAIGSPQILLQSGIGPKNHLQELKIPIINDLEVGTTLRDHASSSLSVCYNASKYQIFSLKENIRRYLQGEGFFTVAAPTEDVAFIKTTVEKLKDFTDLELVLSPNTNGNFPLVALEEFENKFNYAPNCSSFILSLVVLRTKSIGTIRLKSSDHFQYPLIDPQIFTDSKQEDIHTAYEGFKFALKLLNTTSFRQINATYHIPTIPPCSKFKQESKKHLLCVLKHITINGFHPVGTCPMGSDPKEGAVVDPFLRVHGVKSLRVADASIFPTTLTGHPNAACVMVGEKVSDIIKDRYTKVKM